ncbi:vitamin B12-dependent ribonucleotide reductase [Plakobranchus ocellatus]|uniref:Vitamin B12-dependent ribonucleotide reductase n=1 Tax=Plakobranchus ocellatus TaxID=259542 RepID=A0AAV4DFU7_9GAST|nr:vitamin B12-dependent ribonucleotide reductase [Plakobranchus ocellatus]
MNRRRATAIAITTKCLPRADVKEDPDGFAFVCFQAFLYIFGIKKGRLETTKKSLATTGEPPVDGRGKHRSRLSKMSDELKQRLRDHISSFRGRQSHYSHERTRRLYWPGDLNINKIFLLFKEKHCDDSLS